MHFLHVTKSRSPYLFYEVRKETWLTVWLDVKGQVHSLWPLVHGITSRTTRSCKERHQWNMKHWTRNSYDCDWFKTLWETVGHIAYYVETMSTYSDSATLVSKCYYQHSAFHFDYSDWTKVSSFNYLTTSLSCRSSIVWNVHGKVWSLYSICALSFTRPRLGDSRKSSWSLVLGMTCLPATPRNQDVNLEPSGLCRSWCVFAFSRLIFDKCKASFDADYCICLNGLHVMVLYWWCIPRFADVADVRISASMAEPQDSKEVSLACPPPNPWYGPPPLRGWWL